MYTGLVVMFMIYSVRSSRRGATGRLAALASGSRKSRASTRSLGPVEEAADVDMRRVEEPLVALGRRDDRARHRQARRFQERDAPARADEIDEHAGRRPVEAEAHDAIDVGDLLDHLADAVEPVADVAEDHPAHELGVGAARLGEDVEGLRVAPDAMELLHLARDLRQLAAARVALFEEAALVGRLVAEAAG